MIKAPCKKCTTETGRSVEPNCHAYCNSYLAYKDKLEDEKKKIRLEKKQRDDFLNRICH